MLFTETVVSCPQKEGPLLDDTNTLVMDVRKHLFTKGFIDHKYYIGFFMWIEVKASTHILKPVHVL